jgi:hypothetical protein
MKQCTHKTEEDFSFVREDGRKVWTCSNCGQTFLWDEGCSYIGSPECTNGKGYTRGCGFAVMENVACSEKCRDVLGGRELKVDE